MKIPFCVAHYEDEDKKEDVVHGGGGGEREYKEQAEEKKEVEQCSVGQVRDRDKNGKET